MEAVIVKSLSANNEERKQASRHINEIMKVPSAYQEFWGVVVNSSNADARQAAAIHFYKMVQKKKKWNKLPDEVRTRIKESVLERIHQEPEKKVKTVIVQSAGQIALNEVDGWPELFRLIEETIGFEGMTEMKELGMFVISILTEYAPGLFKFHFTALLNVFGSVLTKPEYYGSPLAYLTVISMKNFLLFFVTKEKSVAVNFEYLLPSVLEVIKAQSTRNRPDRSIECLGFFEALLESYPRVVTSHLKFIIEGLLRIAVFLNVDEISCKVLDVISSIICQKTKKIVKDEAILVMLCQTLFEIIGSPKSVEEGQDHYDIYNGDTNVISGAVELLDTLATEIEPELLMKHLMPILNNGVSSNNLYCEKAVFIILGVVVEKCKDQIKSSSDFIIAFITNGLASDSYLPLNGALFTLWSFVLNFKPYIVNYLPDLIVVLLKLLQNFEIRVKTVEAHLVPKIFCILNESCEILDSLVGPMLPIMVPTLLAVVNSNVKVHYRELAISVVGQAGGATKKAFREYFSIVLEVLRPFLIENLPDDQLPLQVQTFDTLGTLFKSVYVKGDEFQLVEDVLNVTLTITEVKNCGELRSGLYSMLSDCSEFMKEKMEGYIPRILKLMDISFKEVDTYNSIHSNEVVVHHGMNLDECGEEQKVIPVKDLKIIEEKEEALMALGNIAFNIGAPFKPYLKQCYQLCYALSSHENDVIRAAAIEALASLYVSIMKYFPEDSTNIVPGISMSLISKFSNVVKQDENVDVVYAVLDGYQKILKNIPQVVNAVVDEGANGNVAVTNGSIIGNAVKLVITEKCHCQYLKIKAADSDDEGDEEEDEDDDDDNDIEDNYSIEDLIIAAEELIPVLGEALPLDIFLIYFSSYQRRLLKLLEKHHANEIRESTSATLGLCAKYLGSYMNVLAIEFAPIFPTLMKDANENVRNNVAFCIAQMVIHGKEAMFSYFNDICSTLLNWLQIENCSMVLDNICSAIASLIIVNKDLLPLDEVVPLFFKYLPLREDFEENKSIFTAFNVLFQFDAFKEYLVKAVKVVLIASINKQMICDDARQEAFKLFVLISERYPNDKEFILLNLPEELRSHFVASL